MDTTPLTVVGGSIASLVAADALVSRGRSVVLHLPDRGVGSGFLPIEHDGRRLELGTRLIELSYDGPAEPAPPLDAYRPGPHGHRPYLALIDALVRDLAADELTPVPGAQVSLDGRLGGDLVFGGDLSGLSHLVDPVDLTRIAAESADAVVAEGPRGLFAPERSAELWKLTFDEVSLRHTGPTFHRLLTVPLADKVLDGGAASVIAALHRKIWLPLFHPATLHDAAAGADGYRPNRPMYVLRDGGMGSLVGRLIERVTNSPAVEVRRSGPLIAIERECDGTRLRFEHGEEVAARSPVVGGTAAEVFTAVGATFQPRRATSTIVWLEVDEASLHREPVVTFVADADVPIFRVSPNPYVHDSGRRVLVCELDHRVDAHDAAQSAVDACEDLGLVDPGTVDVVHQVSGPSFVVPDHASADAFTAAESVLRTRVPDLLVVGPAASFAADSFNEQVVQGLRAAELVDG